MFEDITLTVGQVSLIGIASGLCGFLINHWLAVGRDQRKERRDARREFRNAFVEIERLLEINLPTDPAHPPADWQNAIKLVRKWDKELCSAVIRFEPFLPWHKRLSFRKHWRNYCRYEDYEPKSGEDETARRKLALYRIRQLTKSARV